MPEISTDLMEQREHLIHQAAAQRTALAQNIEPWRLPLARVDQGLSTLRTIKRNPVWLVGGIIILTALRPARMVQWLRGGWLAWQMVRGWRNK